MQKYVVVLGFVLEYVGVSEWSNGSSQVPVIGWWVVVVFCFELKKQ